jgi:hypothetical protein
MSDVHPTAPAAAGKAARPAKPSPDFPLFPHAAGVWAKKIRGRMHYFGPWADPNAALASYLAQKDDLHAGRKPRPDPEALKVKDVVNDFLAAKKALVEAEELTQRTWDDYKEALELLVVQAGKGRLVSDLGPDDFAALRNKAAKRWGPHRLKKLVQAVRSAFKHAFDAGLIDRPARFGPGFKRPTLKVLRLHRAEQGPKLFTAEEVRRLLAAAGTQMKAMVLLGINCGFGNADCGTLPLSALDLDGGWIDFPRQSGHRPALPALAGDGGRDPGGPGGAPDAEGRGRRGAGVPDVQGQPLAHRHDGQPAVQRHGQAAQGRRRQRPQGAELLRPPPHLPHRGRRGEGPARRRLHHGA